MRILCDKILPCMRWNIAKIVLFLYLFNMSCTSDVNKSLDWARNRVAAGLYFEALNCYSTVIRTDTCCAYAYAERAFVKGKLGDYLGSIKDYEKALDLRNQTMRYLVEKNTSFLSLPENTEDILYIRTLYVKELISTAYTKFGDDLSGAVSDFSMALLLDSMNAEAYHCRGNAFYLLKDFASAIKDYTKAVTLRPNQSDAYYARGNAKEQSGQMLGAMEDFRKGRFLDKAEESFHKELLN
jgi:tetratricopeptide (TPR) repeat protein